MNTGESSAHELFRWFVCAFFVRRKDENLEESSF